MFNCYNINHQFFHTESSGLESIILFYISHERNFQIILFKKYTLGVCFLSFWIYVNLSIALIYRIKMADFTIL